MPEKSKKARSKNSLVQKGVTFFTFDRCYLYGNLFYESAGVPLIEKNVSFLRDDLPVRIEFLDVVVVKQVPVSVGRVPTGGCVVASLKVATMVVAHSIEVVRVKALAFLATLRWGDLMIQTRGPETIE